MKRESWVKKQARAFININYCGSQAVITFDFKTGLIPFPHYSISALNETALLVSFENKIDEAINEKVTALAKAFHKNNFKGFVEAVPAYSSLAVFYDVETIKKNYKVETTVFDHVKIFTEKLISKMTTSVITNKEVITIPVHYNGEDLHHVAKLHGLSVAEVISIHTGRPYRVFMIGFLPGFAYMGKVDERIATSRHPSPRINVKAGTVGIAGLQTGIYPMDSPGGWQLIGQTPLKIFDKEKNAPCLLKAGDTIQFISISKEDFKKLNEY